jgi:hypothetical protein
MISKLFASPLILSVDGFNSLRGGDKYEKDEGSKAYAEEVQEHEEGRNGYEEAFPDKEEETLKEKSICNDGGEETR